MTSMHHPAREVPVPQSISIEAQRMLARGPLGAAPVWPALDDADAWRATVHAMNEGALQMFAALGGEAGAAFGGGATSDVDLGGVVAYVAEPAEQDVDDPKAVLNIHGGAWVQGGGALCRAGAPARAAAFGVRTWSLDYRMPPDHPFPAAIDDGLAAYRALLSERRADDIVVAGDSAGANIAAGLMFRLREEGLPLPAGLVLDTPATDLTASGDTLAANDGLDTVLVGDFRPAMALYAGGADPRHPHLSPLYGDFSLGYPATLLLTGTRDRLLSDTVRIHRAMLAAGVDVDLHVFEAQGHGGFMGQAPEDAERREVARSFIAQRLMH